MTPVSGSRVAIHYGEEWAALYLDGLLDRQGEHYYVEERAFDLLGVETVQDDAFLRGSNQRADVATTLAEVAAYRTARDARLAEAADLRRQAAALEARAGEIEAS